MPTAKDYRLESLNMKPVRNLLLVYPAVPPNTYWSFHYTLKLAGKKSAMPPLGLVTMAAHIPGRYNLKLIDLNIEPLPDRDLEWADMVFLSGMLVQKESFHQVAVRARASGKTVVAGGPYVTGRQGKVANVDHCVLGEAENQMDVFFDDLEKGRLKSLYRSDSRPRLAGLRLPRFDLLRLDAYASMSIQYSRGCPFRCEFCDIWQLYGNRPRLKPAESILAELDCLFGLGWRGAVFMVDDNFIGNRRRVKAELLPALIRWQEEHDRPFQFFTEASINLARDRDLMSLMSQAGFNEVFIGIETPEPASLKEIGKSQNLKTDLSRSVAEIQRHGMEVMAGFIIGFDSDTEHVFDAQIDFIMENAIVKAMVGMLIALPGTILYRRLAKENRVLGEAGGNNTHLVNTNFRTRLPSAVLKAGYLRVLDTLYDSKLKNYFARCKLLLGRIGNRDKYVRKVTWDEIPTLFRSLSRQPFTRYGWNYLGFLGHTLLHCPDLFPEAVKLAVQGHHFHVITRQALRAEAASAMLDDLASRLHTIVAPAVQMALATGQSSNRALIKNVRAIKRRLRATRRQIKRLHADIHLDLNRRWQAIAKTLEELTSQLATSTGRAVS